MENKPEQTMSAQKEQKETLKPRHIVFIDDNVGYRYPLAELLNFHGEKEGLTITTRGFSSYTKEAQEHIMSEIPEAVII